MQKNKSVLFMITAGLFLGLMGSAIAHCATRDLKARVEAALDPYSMHTVSVNVDEEGTISIRGEVDALYDKLDIYQIVSGINGVTKIKDLVTVNTPVLPDNMISVNIMRAIKDNSIILEPDKITAIVTNGLVILRGTVSYYKEKLMATTVSSWQDGVLGVENEINVLSSQEARSDENIKSILSGIVENHFPLVDGSVSIKVKKGDVAIEGDVQTLWELNQLKEEFLQVSGVHNVIENIEVKPRL